VKITVCELPDETARREAVWADLVRYLRASPTDVVVLPEMPFCEWEMFRRRTVDLAAWRSALAAHDAMMTRLCELQAGVVLASRPVELQGKRLNQAFAWTRDGGYRGARAKYYLPDEPDGWEASWFDRGDREFSPESAGSVKVGFQLCTELLFSQAAWEDRPEGRPAHRGAAGDRRPSAVVHGRMPGRDHGRLLRRLDESALVRQRRVRGSQLARLSGRGDPARDER
jgi:predicted amidohydrolase